jgi:prolyl oligopeptidase
MKRYHTLLAGASWMAEYGNPDTDDWKFLQQYSPYHSKLSFGASNTVYLFNVWRLFVIVVYSFLFLLSLIILFFFPDIDENANYPPLLVTTSTRDDRVHPGHARKFVKVRYEILQFITIIVMY